MPEISEDSENVRVLGCYRGSTRVAQLATLVWQRENE